MLIINRKIYKEFFLEGMPHIDRNSSIAFCLLVMRSQKTKNIKIGTGQLIRDKAVNY